jgi:tetratricopeptide (TPR) repeat protein
MRRCLLLSGLLAVSAVLWAQQDSSKSSPPPSSSAPAAHEPSAAERNPFPEDDAKAPPPKPSSSAAGREPSAAERNPFPEDDPAESVGPAPSPRTSTMEPPRSDRVRVEDLGPGEGDSSSKDTQIDLSAPADDAKAHPQSSTAVADAEAAALSPDGVSEFHTWDPHRAAKSVEVGDFYFKRKNYRAAEERYREALRYKDNDAVATIRLAECLEKLGIMDDARSEYESYLKILPHGPQAGDAQKALARLKVETAGPK